MPSLVVGLVLGVLITSMALHGPRTESVFVYGTLTNPIIRSIACWCFTGATPVDAPGYQKVGLDIVVDEQEVVTGKIIQVSPQELRRLDRYERVPVRYKRERIIIADTEHWVYIKETTDGGP